MQEVLDKDVENYSKIQKKRNSEAVEQIKLAIEGKVSQKEVVLKQKFMRKINERYSKHNDEL